MFVTKNLFIKTLILWERFIHLLEMSKNVYIGKIEKPSKYHSNKNFLSWEKIFQFWNHKTRRGFEKTKSKTPQDGDVLTKIIKNAEFIIDLIHLELSKTIQSESFPFCLKWADVTHIVKKCLISQVDNYRPVSILLNMWNLWERPLFEQMSLFFDQRIWMF